MRLYISTPCGLPYNECRKRIKLLAENSITEATHTEMRAQSKVSPSLSSSGGHFIPSPRPGSQSNDNLRTRHRTI